MATALERTISIIFAGDDQTAGAFGSVKSNLSSLSTDVEAAAAKLSVITDGVLKMDAALAALAIGGLAYAITKSGEFNSATAEIGTLVDDTSFNIGQYQDSILAYAENSTQSINAITDALKIAVGTGIEYQDSIQLITAAEKLAVAGHDELSGTTKILIGVLSAYGAGIDEAAHYSDVLFQTVKLGAATLPELSEQLSGVLSVAAAAKIPIETVGAAVATLTTQSMPTAEAVTAVRSAIQAMIAPSAEATKTAQSLGIEFSASALASKGFEGVLKEVYTATGGNVEILSQLFGNVRALTAVTGLFGQEGGRAFLDALAEMQNASGSTSVAYEKMVENIEYVNQRLINSMQTTFIKVGQPLLDEYGALVLSLANLFKGVNIGLDQGAFNAVFQVLQNFGTQLAQYIDGIAKALPQALQNVDFTGFANAVKDLGGAFADFLGGLDLTNADDLAQALQVIVDVMTGLIRVTEGMVDAFRPYIQQVAEFFIELSKGDEATQQFAGQILAYAKMISTAGLEIVAVMLAMQQTGTSMADALSYAGSGISLIWNTLTIAIKEFMLVFVELAIEVNNILNNLTFGMTDFFANSNTKLQAYSDSLRSSIQQDRMEWAGAFDSLTGGFLGLENLTRSTASALENWRTRSSQAGAAALDTASSVGVLSNELGDIPEDKAIYFTTTGIDGVRAQLSELGWDISQIPLERIIELAAAPDQASFQSTYQALVSEFPDARPMSIMADADENSVTNAGAYIDGAIPGNKWIGVGASADQGSISTVSGQLDTLSTPRTTSVKPEVDKAAIEQIKGQFELMQAAVEWKAKLDIAEVEANAKIVEALAGSLSAAFTSSADIISSAVSGLSNYDQVFDITGNRDFLKGVIEDELSMRERAMEATEALISKQIDFMNAKLEAMSRGEALIQIDGAGLQPHLEAFMWEILSAIQTRVNEEGHAMLFGI